MKRPHIALLISSALLAGCDGGPLGDPIVPLAEVIPSVLEKAQKELPGYAFDTAYKTKVDGKDAYEIRGKNKQGKVREVEISTAGEVLAIE